MVRPVAGDLPEQVKNNQSVNTAAGNGGQKMSQYSWFTVYDVALAMHLYLNVWPIEKCLSWDNPVVYLFALFDRRIGKRTVKKIYEDRFNKPKWIQRFICLRAEAEGIRREETEHK